MDRALRALFLLMPCLPFALAAAAAVPPAPAPPGAHPRLLFTEAGVPAIRERTKDGEGAAMLAGLRAHAAQCRRTLETADAGALAKLRAESLQSWNKVAPSARDLAFLFVLTGEPADGDLAVRWFRLWLDANPPDDALKPAFSWGNGDYAMAYDWLHGVLSPAERDRARRILAAMIGEPTMRGFGREWYMGGPTTTMRAVTGANWLALCTANLGLTAMAIEEEPGANPACLAECVRLFRRFQAEGVAPDGAMYEGMSYATGFGTHFTPQFIMALRLRGLDVVPGSHLRNVPFWIAHETLPWGYEAFDLNKSAGNYGPGPYATFLAREFGGLAVWMIENFTLRDAGGLPDTVVSLVGGIPDRKNDGRTGLPLSRWFSTRGTVFCRSGWGPRDALFSFVTNPPGAGHTHADQGSFCLAANGAYFIADSGPSKYASTDHNLVHIDGVGQPQREGAVDSFVRSVTLSRYADIVDADLSLSYERVIHGDFNGPWWWHEYNPVEKADRRALFVRGATGPLLLIADDIRKDGRERTYDWLAHVPTANPAAADGRRFSIRETYGGPFLRTLERGAESTMKRDRVPAGLYRGWLLVRSEPSPAAWASNDLFVNDRPCPYDTAYFGRGFFREGWRWLPLMPDRKAEIVLPDGPLRLRLRANSGGRTGPAVFTTDPAWTPGTAVPDEAPGRVVLRPDEVEHGAVPWTADRAPAGVLDGLFLGSAPVSLRVETFPDARTKLRAVRKAAGARFLCLMAPHDDGDGRSVEVPAEGGGQTARLVSPAGRDIVGGAVDAAATAGELATDAVAAAVSFGADGAVRGYAAVSATLLNCRGRRFLASSGGSVHVANDGTLLSVRGPGGARAECLRLGATRVSVNGVEAALRGSGETAEVSIPVPARGWRHLISKGGRRVEMTGGGPGQPKVRAPEAVDVVVNGVSRYFVSDGKGSVLPLLEQGHPTIRYRNRLEAADLSPRVVEGKAGIIPSSRVSARAADRPVLLPETGALAVALPVPAPGLYRLTVEAVAPAGAEISAAADGTALPGTVPCVGGLPGRGVFPGRRVDGKEIRLSLSGPKGWALSFVEIEPVLRPLTPDLWQAAGPYPAGETRAALEEAFAPEKVPGAVPWVPGNSTAGFAGPGGQWSFAEQARKAGVNFLPPLGVRRGSVCYARIFVESPDDRPARLALGVDWWANVYVNGEKIVSERSPSSAEMDGAQFNTDTLMPAAVRLRKGVNTILVKVAGGSGSASFQAFISDPGDLKIRATPGR